MHTPYIRTHTITVTQWIGRDFGNILQRSTAHTHASCSLFIILLFSHVIYYRKWSFYSYDENRFSFVFRGRGHACIKTELHTFSSLSLSLSTNLRVLQMPTNQPTKVCEMADRDEVLVELNCCKWIWLNCICVGTDVSVVGRVRVWRYLCKVRQQWRCCCRTRKLMDFRWL